MKKSLSILTCLILSVMICFISCGKADDPTAPLSSQILGKWIITEAIGSYTDLGINRKDTTRFTSADYFVFSADSTLTIVADGITYNGKWHITNNLLFIKETKYFDRNGLELSIHTNTDLQLYYTVTTEHSYLEQKLNLRR